MARVVGSSKVVIPAGANSYTVKAVPAEASEVFIAPTAALTSTTLSFEGSWDNGTTYMPLTFIAAGATVAALSFATQTSNSYRIPVGGLTHVRVKSTVDNDGKYLQFVFIDA